MIKLYIDDLQTSEEEGFIVVRTFDEAVKYVLQNGMPDFISFDHDLGLDEDGTVAASGYDFAKWPVESDLNGEIEISEKFDFKVHSQNPVGRKNIEGLLSNYLMMRRRKVYPNHQVGYALHRPAK